MAKQTKIKLSSNYHIHYPSTISQAGIEREASIHLPGATQGVSELQELKKNLEEQITMREELSEKFLIASKLSFDGLWDWNLLTNEFFLGKGFEELFGYAFNNIDNIAFDWVSFLHADDKVAVEKGIQDALASSASHWEHSYRFVKPDGSIAKVFGRASIIRDADGKARHMTGIIHDLSRQKELEEKLDHEIVTIGKLLKEIEENFKLIFNSSSDVLFDADLLADKVIMNSAYDKDFGHKLKSDRTPGKDWISHIHPDDKEAVTKDYLRILASDESEWKYTYRFLRGDDSVANVLSSGIILRNAGGEAYRIISYMHDISNTGTAN